MATLRVDTILSRHTGGRISIPGGISPLAGNFVFDSVLDIQSAITLEGVDPQDNVEIDDVVVFGKAYKSGSLVHLTTRGFSFESTVASNIGSVFLNNHLPASYRPPESNFQISTVTNSFRGLVGAGEDSSFSDMAVAVAETGRISFHIAGGFTTQNYTVPSISVSWTVEYPNRGEQTMVEFEHELYGAEGEETPDL